MANGAAVITPGYIQTMARYNAWQNDAVYSASSRLSDGERRLDKGAFFKSIHATLNHILWADQMWLARFGVRAEPAAKTIASGLAQYESWDDLASERRNIDGELSTWAGGLNEAGLSGDLKWYSATYGKEFAKPRALALVHLFNHQTHHRGQVHAILTGFAIDPGPTDLAFMP